jgi:DHA1 family bicyclomycin/chloramphenicol resistance-like MFS transporter
VREAKIHPAEFVTLAAMLMALAALGMDTMLVALPDIARTFSVPDENDRQLVVTTYLLGMAAGQPFYGPLSDRFGRKPILAAGIVLFILGSLWAFLALSFGAVPAARAVQGFGAASPRVLVTAIVRDRFSGREMARTMSFVMLIFIMVPIFALAIVAGILHLFGPWHWIFVFLLLAACLVLGWMILRLPETRHDSDQVPMSTRSLSRNIVTVVTEPHRVCRRPGLLRHATMATFAIRAYLLASALAGGMLPMGSCRRRLLSSGVANSIASRLHHHYGAGFTRSCKTRRSHFGLMDMHPPPYL